MPDSCLLICRVVYGDQHVSDQRVRATCWSLRFHCSQVGARGSYRAATRVRSAVFHRCGRAAGAPAWFRRVSASDHRVLPGVLAWAEGRSGLAGAGDGGVLPGPRSRCRSVDLRGRRRDEPPADEVPCPDGCDRAGRGRHSGDSARGPAGPVRVRLFGARRNEERLHHRGGESGVTVAAGRDGAGPVGNRAHLLWSPVRSATLREGAEGRVGRSGGR